MSLVAYLREEKTSAPTLMALLGDIDHRTIVTIRWEIIQPALLREPLEINEESLVFHGTLVERLM